MKKKRSLVKTVAIPEGVQVELTPVQITVTGEKGSVVTQITFKRITIAQKDNSIVLSPKGKGTRKDKSYINTFASLLQNHFHGVQTPYVYTLKVCSSHFPMSAAVKDGKVEVTNFLGEKIPRICTIKEGVEVSIEGDLITVSSPDKALAGQMSTDIEQMMRRPAFDKRVFMDGIYLIEKGASS